MITLNGEDLLKLANSGLQKESWVTTSMLITIVEQHGDNLIFYGTGFSSTDNFVHLALLRRLDKFANVLGKKYRLAE